MNSRDTDIARLRQALRSENRHERAVAAVELGRLGAGDSLEDLRAMVDDRDDLVAVSAMFGCWKLGDETLPMNRMAASLASADEESVQLTVQALCEMGSAAVPQLVDLLDAGSPHARYILRILSDIGGSESHEAVQRVTFSEDRALADIARTILEDWSDD